MQDFLPKIYCFVNEFNLPELLKLNKIYQLYIEIIQILII